DGGAAARAGGAPSPEGVVAAGLCAGAPALRSAVPAPPAEGVAGGALPAGGALAAGGAAFEALAGALEAPPEPLAPAAAACAGPPFELAGASSSTAYRRRRWSRSRGR